MRWLSAYTSRLGQEAARIHRQASLMVWGAKWSSFCKTTVILSTVFLALRKFFFLHVFLYVPYIRLFTRLDLSENSTLKQCINYTGINISRNHSKSLNLPDLQETVSNLPKCIFSRLWYSREQSGKWMHAEKTWYTVYVWSSSQFKVLCYLTSTQFLGKSSY